VKIRVDRVDDVREQGRRAAENEDADNRQRYCREILLASLTKLQVLPLPLAALERDNQTNVQEKQRDQRQEEQRYRIEHARVEVSVDGVGTDLRFRHHR